MGILDLDSQMNFGDDEGLKVWFHDHQVQHQMYVAKLTGAYNTQPPSFDLIDDGAINDWISAMKKKKEGVLTPRLLTWMQAHERLHSVELNAIGSGTTISLSTSDFRDDGQFYDWMTYHQDLHDLQDTVLL